MVTFVCISLVAANLPGGPGGPGGPGDPGGPPADVEDYTTNVKITANVVRGKSWNLYSYVIGNEGFINLVKYVYNHTI